MIEAKPRPGETMLPDAARDAGISYRTLDYWVRQGYVRMRVDQDRSRAHVGDYRGAGGSGNPRYLSPMELQVCLIMARLVRAGLVPAVAAKAARGFALKPTAHHVDLAPGVRLTIRRAP